MPSPFPGMDPYLEDPATWPDLHLSLMAYIREALQPELRPNYVARLDLRLYVVKPHRTIHPDVTIVRQTLREATPGYSPATTVREYKPPEVAEPYVIILPEEQHREPYIQIIHTPSGQVVTVIEILSPANKLEGEGRMQYLRKQDEILNSDANLVEIDLLSYGARSPLPRFRIPLRTPDPDVTLDLQAVFTRAYDSGGYADVVDYTQPATATLTAEEQSWVDHLLRQKGYSKVS